LQRRNIRKKPLEALWVPFFAYHEAAQIFGGCGGLVTLRANGSRQCASDDRLGEAIHARLGPAMTNSNRILL
jgi:hypothetical protein